MLKNSCDQKYLVLVGILFDTVPISSEDAGVEDLLPKCKSSDSLITVGETNNIYMTFITSTVTSIYRLHFLKYITGSPI